jgi:ribosomal protein S18 acetylase RimI-like enzyme
MLSIRTFQHADKSDVIQLWRECNLVVPWNDPATDIEKKINFQPDLFFVGEFDEKIIATCMAGYEGHRGWINYLAVAPDFRRQGFGRAIMLHAEIKLKELGCPKINLQVRAQNTSVIQFYGSLGFKDDNVTSLGKRLDG